MKRSQSLLCCSVLAVAAATVVSGVRPTSAHPASLPFWGPTGLGVIATTDTVKPKEFQLGLGYERVRPSIGGHVDFFPVLSGEYGFKKGEVGVGYSREKDHYAGLGGTYDDYTINAKYRFYESKRRYGLGATMNNGAMTNMTAMDEGTDVPDSAVAVGVQYIKFGGGFGHLSDVYVTGSKVLTQKDDGKQMLRGHVGLIYQQDRRGVNNSYLGDQNVLRPFVGLEYKINPKFSVAGDYLPASKQSTKVYSVVARYQATRGAKRAVGLWRFRLDLDRHQ